MLLNAMLLLKTVIISALNAIANAIEGIESAKIRLRLKFWPNNFESPLYKKFGHLSIVHLRLKLKFLLGIFLDR